MRLKFTSETIDKSTEIVCTAGEHIGTYSFPPIKLTLCLIYIDAVTGATAIGVPVLAIDQAIYISRVQLVVVSLQTVS